MSPATCSMRFHKSGSDPQVYKVMEQYDSPEALDAHGKTDYFREANKQLAIVGRDGAPTGKKIECFFPESGH